MNENYPNPWDFSNRDKQFKSPDGVNEIEYSELREIGMGGPLSGICFVITSGKKYEISDWCAGPPVWEKEGRLVAVPVWKRKFLSTIQQIIIVDIEAMTKTIYSEAFSVLAMQSFNVNIISGYESPRYKSKILNFDIIKSKVAKTDRLSIDLTC